MMDERPAGSFELQGPDGRSVVRSVRVRTAARWALVGTLVMLLVALFIVTLAPIMPGAVEDGALEGEAGAGAGE